MKSSNTFVDSGRYLQKTVPGRSTRLHEAGSKNLLLTGASLGFVVVLLDVTIVNVALQQIDSSIGAGVSGLQWIVNAYTLVLAALILTAGALGDRMGVRRVFIAGFSIFGLASLACGVSTSAILLIVSRAIQGVGAAILVPCSLTLLNHNFKQDAERDRAVSIWAAGSAAALAAGPVIGGLLIASVGWRSIFFVNVPLAMLGIWLVWRHSEETERSRDRGFDWPGQFFAILALADLAASMIEGGTLGWTHPLILAGFGVFLAAIAAFVLVELRSRAPMLPLHVFRNRTFTVATVIGLIINVAFYGLIFVLSLFFQRTQKYSALNTGLAFLPMTGIVLAANLASGRLTTRVGARLPILTGQTLMIAGLLGLVPAKEGTPYLHIAAQLLLVGAGLGLTVPAMTSALLGTVEKSQSGIASGVLNAARQAGSVVGVSLFGTFIGQENHMIPGLRMALLVSSAILLLSFRLAFRIPDGGFCKPDIGARKCGV
jgi:MFS transporter, DHA2 family, methylenomycin A resistance protein